jgi:hypothetical protein
MKKYVIENAARIKTGGEALNLIPKAPECIIQSFDALLFLRTEKIVFAQKILHFYSVF